MRVEFQVTESGGGGSVTNPVIERLRIGRNRIAEGWARNISNTERGSRSFYCLTGSIFHGLPDLALSRFSSAVGALAAALPEGFTGTHALIQNLAPDDLGETLGYGRGDSDTSARVASFNNTAPNKQAVLDLMDRAIAMEIQKEIAVAA